MMRSGTRMMVVGIALFVVCGMLAPTAAVLLFIMNMPQRQQFIGPGETTVAVEKPGHIYLWNDYETVFGGVNYSRERDLPDGLTFSVSDAETGTALPFVGDASSSESGTAGSSVSVGYVAVDRPMTLRVVVGGSGTPRVFSIGAGFLGRLFMLILAMVGVMVVAVGGLAMAVLGGLRRHAAQRQAAAAEGL